MTDGLSASDVALLSNGTGNNNNDGFGGGGAWWILILFVLFGFGRGGFGGGYGGDAGTQGALTRADLHETISSNGLQNSITNLSSQMCTGLAGVNSNIANLGYQAQQCCCETKSAIEGVNYNMAMQTNALQNSMNSGFRDVIESQNNGTQRIIDTITQNKMDALRTELQSAQLVANNEAQTRAIIESLRPTAVPAYTVQSPYATMFGNGCAC